jgi:tape measure domain-containing protein
MILRELTTLLNFDLDESKLRRYTQDMEAAKSLANEAAGSIARAAQGVGTAMMGVGRGMSMAITAPIMALGAWSAKTAGDMEQLQIAYTTLLGSAEKATAFTQELLKFAAQTPFEFSELTQYSKLLLAARVEQEKIIPTLSMLGDISSLVGREKLPYMMRALVDVKNKTKLTGEETRQFVNAGIALVPMLADTMGKTTAQITEMMSKGAIKYEDVVETLKRATSKGGKYYRGMSAQAGAFNQLLSNIADNFYQVRVELGKMLMDTLHLKKGVSLLVAALGYLVKILKGMPNWMRPVVVVFGLLLAAIGPVLVIVGSLIAAFGGLYIQAMALNILMGGTLMTVLGGLAASFMAVLGTVALFVAGIFILWVAFDDFFGWVDGKESVLGDIFGSFQDILNNGFDFSVLKKTFQIFFDDLITMGEHFWDSKVGKLFDWMIKWNPALLPLKMLEQASGTLGYVSGALPGAASTVAGTISKAAQSVSLIVNSTIAVAMPEGTPEGQRNYVELAAKNAVKETWDKELRNLFRQYPLAE